MRTQQVSYEEVAGLVHGYPLRVFTVHNSSKAIKSQRTDPSSICDLENATTGHCTIRCAHMNL